MVLHVIGIKTVSSDMRGVNGSQTEGTSPSTTHGQ
jgi:hypothetical protein